MRPRTKKPKLGQAVKVVWVDSGAGGLGKPAKGKLRLSVATTYGVVSAISEDPKIHGLLCRRGQQCICEYIELTMCGSGPSDIRSDLAAIWIPAVISVAVLQEAEKGRAKKA